MCRLSSRPGFRGEFGAALGLLCGSGPAIRLVDEASIGLEHKVTDALLCADIRDRSQEREAPTFVADRYCLPGKDTLRPLP